MTLQEFIHMGGYGSYVWSSYAIALLVLLLNVIVPMLQHKKFLKETARRLRRRRQVQ